MALKLRLLPEPLAICRLDAAAAPPAWAGGSLVSLTRTPDELSVVCRQQDVPDGIRCDGPWRCFQVAGPLDLSEVGVLASLAQPLAAAEVSVFVISTFDTDYLLVRQCNVHVTAEVLRKAGHVVSGL